ncbi:MAG: DUF551 domain-containing protein [Lachnospiraceae bacterium]|nr:DUF551 domain-containing protein [Lachnospiraceae bacterium]
MILDGVINRCVKCANEYEQLIELARKIEVLKQEQKTEWIPVSERLPDKGGQYLVTLHFSTHDVIDVISYARNLYLVDEYDFSDKKRPGWFDYDSEYGYYERGDVIAWQPLPEPYKVEME